MFCFGLFHWRLRRAERTDSTKDLNFWHIWKWVKSKSHEYFWAPFLLHYMASYKKYVSYVMKSNTATKNWNKYFTIFVCIFFNGCIVSFCSSLSYQQNKKKRKQMFTILFCPGRFLSKNKTMSKIPKGIEIPGRQHVLFTSFALCIFEHITMIVWDKCKYFQSVLFW